MSRKRIFVITAIGALVLIDASISYGQVNNKPPHPMTMEDSPDLGTPTAVDHGNEPSLHHL
jgi:hypothetical protein